MTAISLPDRDEQVKAAVDGVWEFVSEVEDLAMLKYERKKSRVSAALEGLSDEEVFAEIQARRTGATVEEKSVKGAELEPSPPAARKSAKTGPTAIFSPEPCPEAAGTSRG
jgi:hypothetical protein